MEVNCTHDQRACMTVRFTSYIAAHDGVRRDEVQRKMCDYAKGLQFILPVAKKNE